MTKKAHDYFSLFAGGRGGACKLSAGLIVSWVERLSGDGEQLFMSNFIAGQDFSKGLVQITFCCSFLFYGTFVSVPLGVSKLWIRKSHITH